MRTTSNEVPLLSGNSSVGRAQPCQGWGREFESRFPLQFLFRNYRKSKQIKIKANRDPKGPAMMCMSLSDCQLSLVSRSNFSSEITEHPNKEKQSDSRSQGASDDVHVAQRLPVEMFTQVSFRLLGLGSNNSKTKQRA